MNSEIIAVGHELLMGEIVDTNTSFLAQELSKAGIPVRWSGAIGDDLDDLNEAFSRAVNRADVLITTGGLGPTSDDLTREAVARVVNEEMVVDPDLLEWLKGVFERRGMAMPDTNIKQATLIPSAETVPNPQGTAPGWWVRKDGTHIILLPGPPRELQRMWRETVGPELARISGVGAVATRTLKTAGITEGGIDEMLNGLFGRENPYLGIYAHPDGIHLRMIARASDDNAAQDLIRPMEEEIRSIVGHAIWGVDNETPGHSAGAILGNRGMTLGVIEGVSGGALASQLAQVPDNGAFFRGSLITGPGRNVPVDPVAADENGATSLADQARKIFGTDVGLGLTMPTSDEPDGVYHVAVTNDSFQHTFASRISYSQAATMQRSATTALVELVKALSTNSLTKKRVVSQTTLFTDSDC